MIKQDNRPNKAEDELEKKIRVLKHLLSDHPPSAEQKKETIHKSLESNSSKEEKDNLPDKSAMITVSGDNNIISTGESKVLIFTEESKRSKPLKLLLFCILFF